MQFAVNVNLNLSNLSARPINLGDVINILYCQMEDRTIVLTKFRCKNYYSLFIEKLVSEPSTVGAWKKSFSELPDWGDCFVNIYKSSKDDKLSTIHF